MVVSIIYGDDDDEYTFEDISSGTDTDLSLIHI